MVVKICISVFECRKNFSLSLSAVGNVLKRSHDGGGQKAYTFSCHKILSTRMNVSYVRNIYSTSDAIIK